MLAIISAGIAPGFALLSYFYLRDTEHTEPIPMVLRSFIFGALLVFPIMFIQYAFQAEGLLQSSFSEAFLLSGLLEEFFKWFILVFTIYSHTELDAPYDGIVYGVAVSLGFATVENILYLLSNGVHLAIGRAILPVSSHALFGVLMGYYLGKAKFSSKSLNEYKHLIFSLFISILLHGSYDYILLTIHQYWMIAMFPFMLALWLFALRKVKLAHLASDKMFMHQSSNGKKQNNVVQ